MTARELERVTEMPERERVRLRMVVDEINYRELNTRRLNAFLLQQ